MFTNHKHHVRVATFAFACSLLGTHAFAQNARRPAGLVEQADTPYEDVEEILGTLQRQPGSPFSEDVRVKLTGDGHVRFLGTPPLAALAVRDASQEPGVIATGFVQRSRKLLGADDPATDFVTLRTKDGSSDRTVVKLQQSFLGIPVFGSSVIVQLGSENGVECLITDIDHDASGLRAATDSLTDVLPPQEVVARAIDSLGTGAPVEATDPELMIFSPEVLGGPGDAVLVWLFETDGGTPGRSRRFLIDAVRGEVVRDYPLAHDALDRKVYDADNTSGVGILRRSEGDGPAALADVNMAYDFLGDTYDFYDQNHARDSVDGAGLTMSASVRHCYWNGSSYPFGCNPMQNAFWFQDRMWFGDGYATDDVTSHEVTHGVTEHESGLIYENHAGAINESLSDIWGEFVDLSNTGGNDSAGVRWLMGEDLPGGAIRDMQDPPVYSDPDRIGSSFFIRRVQFPSASNDYGGVHTNSGVNNKLCSLLTDGGVFNGQLFGYLGIPAVADLYYEAQVNLLMPASDYSDLNDILQQAALNLGWSISDRDDVYRACVAVEIEPAGNITVQTGATGFEDGSALNPFDTVAEGVAAVSAGGLVSISGGTYDEVITISAPCTLTTRFAACQIGAANGSNACADAPPISHYGTFSFDNSAATMDGLAACEEFGFTQIDHDIWYRWSSTLNNLPVTLSTCGATGVDTKIAVYTGTACGSTTPLACNDDTCGTQTEVSFTATAGTEYLIRVGTYFGAPGGSGTFTIALTP
jgi:Zn-dependent metalloprotease